MEFFSLDLLKPSNAGVVDFVSYLLGTLFIILLPGPNSIYVLSITTQRGWKLGAWSALGIFIEDLELIRTGPFDAAVCPDASLADLDAEAMVR